MTEAMLLAHGFTVEMLVDLIRAGLATLTTRPGRRNGTPIWPGVGAGWSLRERMVEAAKSHWRRRDTTACRCGMYSILRRTTAMASLSMVGVDRS